MIYRDKRCDYELEVMKFVFLSVLYIHYKFIVLTVAMLATQTYDPVFVGGPH